MTRAAEMLRMSQPAVSTTIAALEHSIGLTLFVRRGSRLHPTPKPSYFTLKQARPSTRSKELRRPRGRSGPAGAVPSASLPIPMFR
ncbi:LysR family transcriptional regulator [Rhizobium leguminosarum]|uniref:LysR family transcriptional regulator n=1 Tax=Rhizobium leguminosarum TaxID=384 RepID=UPI001FD98CFF|nr:LysR family transcriptional regulator [Rhizobium leguminosarum]